MKYNFENISLVIPTNQSYDTLCNLFDQCFQLSSKVSLIVVDDGSNPPIVLKGTHSSIVLIRNSLNLGKGASLKIGIEKAISLRKQGVVCLDADGQHPPELIPKFLKFANDNQSDLVIGNRLNRLKFMPIDRWLSNTFTSLFLSILTFKHLPDIQCGFRFISLTQWNSIKADTNGFEWEVQFLIQAIKHKWNIAFLPIPTVYLKIGKSSIRKVHDTALFLKMMYKEFVHQKKNFNTGSGAAR